MDTPSERGLQCVTLSEAQRIAAGEEPELIGSAAATDGGKWSVAGLLGGVGLVFPRQ